MTRHIVFTTIVWLLVGYAPGPVMAQVENVVLAGRRQPARVSVLPLYQHFEQDGLQISEFSTILFAYLPVKRNLAVGLRVNQLHADGDDIDPMSGFTDAQLSLSYVPTIGRTSLALSLTVNIPSGKEQFTVDEFRTLSLICLHEYGFQVPSLGQGLGVTPSMTMAFPVRDALVLGFGVAYQYRGAYEPLADMIEKYNTGDELLVTGGLDARVGASTTFSTDISYAVYGRDKLGNNEVFESGDKVVVSAQLRRTVEDRKAWLFARYRSRARNSLAVDGVFVKDSEKTTPRQLEFIGQYRFPFYTHVDMGLTVEASFFEAIQPVRGEIIRGSIGLIPEIVASRRMRVPIRLVYVFGDISGFEVGLGLRAEF